MTQRSRTRRVLKWVGAIGCVTTAALWIVSAHSRTYFAWGLCEFNVSDGGVQVFAHQIHGDSEIAKYLERWLNMMVGSGWIFENLSPRLSKPSGWPNPPVFDRVHPLTRLAAGKNDPSLVKTWSFVRVIVPLWLLLILCAVPTSVLWWRDRQRFASGHCQQCGYNLTGNISGRCPECGVETRSGGP